MDKYEPLPPQPKYDLHQPRPEYDSTLPVPPPPPPPPPPPTTHEYDPMPPQVPATSDDEALVYAPSVGAEQLGEPPPPMPEPAMPLGYFSHYALDTHGSLDTHDSLDYSVLDALLEGASYPQPGESSGSHEHYHDYPHY